MASDQVYDIRVHVGGLPPDIEPDLLESKFQSMKGTVQQTEIIHDARGSCRGFAYVSVQFPNESFWHQCRKRLHGALWKGQRLSLDVARPHYTLRLKAEREAPAPPEKHVKNVYTLRARHAKDLNPVTDESARSRTFWRRGRYGRAIRIVRIRRPDGQVITVDPIKYGHQLKRMKVDEEKPVEEKSVQELTWFPEEQHLKLNEIRKLSSTELHQEKSIKEKKTKKKKKRKVDEEEQETDLAKKAAPSTASVTAAIGRRSLIAELQALEGPCDSKLLPPSLAALGHPVGASTSVREANAAVDLKGDDVVEEDEPAVFETDNDVLYLSFEDPMIAAEEESTPLTFEQLAEAREVPVLADDHPSATLELPATVEAEIEETPASNEPMKPMESMNTEAAPSVASVVEMERPTVGSRYSIQRNLKSLFFGPDASGAPTSTSIPFDHLRETANDGEEEPFVLRFHEDLPQPSQVKQETSNGSQQEPKSGNHSQKVELKVGEHDVFEAETWRLPSTLFLFPNPTNPERCIGRRIASGRTSVETERVPIESVMKCFWQHFKQQRRSALKWRRQRQQGFRKQKMDE